MHPRKRAEKLCDLLQMALEAQEKKQEEAEATEVDGEESE